MHIVAEKFEMFDSAKARPMLLEFKFNYERVVSGLERCWAKIQDEKSVRADIMARLAKANEALREARMLGLRFVRRDESAAPTSEIRCPNCGATGLRAAFIAQNNAGFGFNQQAGRHLGGDGANLTCPNPNCRMSFNPQAIGVKVDKAVD